MLSQARRIIVGTIDWFHQPFARFIPTQTFRYLACGGSNVVVNIGIYSLCLKFLFPTENITLFGSFNMASSVAAWVIAFAISFPMGFTLSRYVVFPESNLHGRVQFFRYAMTTVTFILITYVLIKVFDILLQSFMTSDSSSYALMHTVTYTIIQVIIAVISYISQRKFTFKTEREELEEIEEALLDE